MKVRIGSYNNESFGKWYSSIVNLFKSSEQTIKVKIDPQDTWSMDHTLSHIILPMLVQLKRTKHGAPYVDISDVPDHLQETNDVDGFDQNHFKRWDWVLDEMIWAFNQKTRDSWEDDFFEWRELGEEEKGDDIEEMLGMKVVWEDQEGLKAHQDRMTNGFRLFGKYYESLWD